MDGVRVGPILGNKKKMGLMVAIGAIAALLIGGTAFASTGHVVEAKSKNKNKVNR